MRITLTFIFLFFIFTGNCQNSCGQNFISDTLYLPSQDKTLNGESMSVALKDHSIVKMFKTVDQKYYLKFFITKNLYFNKIDMLEIRSGSKSYYAKESTQYKVNKSTGMYVVEIYKNYVSTLKEAGITGLVFGKVETDFKRKDAGEIKEMAKCFYESIAGKK